MKGLLYLAAGVAGAVIVGRLVVRMCERLAAEMNAHAAAVDAGVDR